MTTDLYILSAIFLVIIIVGGVMAERSRRKNEQYIPPKVEDPLLKMMAEQPIPIYRTASVTAYTEGEFIAYLQNNYKYWALNSSGSVRYWLGWYGDETPWFADLYYNGNEYTLESNRGIFYFVADDYAPEAIPTELREVLPDIQKTLDGFWVFEYPRDEYWNYNTLVQLAQRDNEEYNMLSAINLLMLCWYFHSEAGMEKNYIDHFEEVLGDQFNTWKRYEFQHEPLFLFAMGWMLRIAPALWKVDDNGETGIEYLLKAHQLEPANPLYKWAVSDQLNLTREATRALAAQVQPSQFDGLEPFIKDYFMEILQGDAQS